MARAYPQRQYHGGQRANNPSSVQQVQLFTKGIRIWFKSHGGQGDEWTYTYTADSAYEGDIEQMKALAKRHTELNRWINDNNPGYESKEEGWSEPLTGDDVGELIGESED